MREEKRGQLNRKKKVSDGRRLQRSTASQPATHRSGARARLSLFSHLRGRASRGQFPVATLRRYTEETNGEKRKKSECEGSKIRKSWRREVRGERWRSVNRTILPYGSEKRSHVGSVVSFWTCLKKAGLPGYRPKHFQALLCATEMLSLDEPLDLKLTLSKVKETRERTIKEPSAGTDNTRSCQLKRTEDDVAVTIPSLPATSDAGFPLLPGPLSQSKGDSRHQSSAVMELRLSPTSNLEMSPGPALSPSELPDGDGSSSSFSMDSHPARFIEGGTSSQAFQFFLPVGSGAGLQLPSSMFIGSPKEKRISPELCIDEQLACRWVKCNLLFDSLQDLVDHVNDFHVKPEKDSGYCCHWEGCARRGRGFNARYKMLIHIRTHTNEKPHRCPVCNKSFSRLENLKIHNRSHTGEKPYICPYEGCNKRYSNSSDRFKHTRTHYIDKPYYCKMAGCLKRYTDPSSLRKHIKAHGHFVSHDQQASLLKGNRHLNKGAVDIPYMSGAHIVIPGTAAPLFRSHALHGLGTALPLPLSSAHPLDLSALACAGLGSPSLSTLSSPILSLIGTPIGLTKTSMLSPSFSSGGLGLPMVSVLAGSSDKLGLAKDLSVKSPSHSKQAGPKSSGRLRSDSDGLADTQGAVLNLSTGPGSLARPDSLAQGWVVIPPGSVVLKPAVVN